VDRVTLLKRIALWLCFAVALTAPGSLHLSSVLLGDPAIDVWNHAWGYWFVADSLAQGRLPFETPLVGGPDGGVLYFIDTPGALAMLPVTWLFGPATAYNLALISRIALAGLAAQLLAEELLGERGAHGWVAGVAYASTPFLLCELTNGISEVCATQWLALTLWAAARAMGSGRTRDWLLLGLMQGITSVTTFYYGLTSALVLVLTMTVWLGWRTWKERAVPFRTLAQGVLAAFAGLVLVLPHWMVFRRSLSSDRALIRRSMELNAQLMEHNAVDPRVYVTPGDFQSVDLLTVYGEPFVHTGYLRWAVIVLAIAAAWQHRKLRPWFALGVASLVFGLGPYLWWNGEWLQVGGRVLSLPFDWLRQVLPQVAITHPLRLSLAAQALFAALAGVGAVVVATAVSRDRRRIAVTVLLASVVVGEGLFGSAARWPIPTSDAAVPQVYVDAPEGMVLDLPAEVGTGMETSRYFWYQTVHGQPIPYTPDVRMGSARDPVVFRAFAKPSRNPMEPVREVPKVPSRELLSHLKATYGLIVVHPELQAQAGLNPTYESVFSQVFGPPESVDGVLVFRPGGR
jgi:hypothetical protein